MRLPFRFLRAVVPAVARRRRPRYDPASMRTGQGGRAAWSGLVAVVCTAVGVLLWFNTTAAALREREHLETVERAHLRLRDELSARLSDLAARREALAWDPQTILVAIDEAGLTPAELLGASVPGMPPLPAWRLATEPVEPAEPR